jgi:NAD(P)H-hydrate epimerase
MRYIMDSVQMKKIDGFSINEVGIPSMVLMERAALNVSDLIKNIFLKKDRLQSAKALIVCGAGNNGADGIAAARQLGETGVRADIYMVSGREKGTEELKQQLSIAEKLGIRIVNQPDFSEYNCIVDALFGIGLSRPVEGIYAKAVEDINSCAKSAFIVSIDVPSGISADDGSVLGTAVNADYTVTFGYLKRGLCLYPGKAYAGNVSVCNAGFAGLSLQGELKEKAAFTYEKSDIKEFFYRPKQANKGTFGKVLIIAGSKDMAGAAVLSARAAVRTGCGLVKVFTHEDNRAVVLNHQPEAILVTYNESSDIASLLSQEMQWADCIVAGPGLSQSDTAQEIMNTLFSVRASKKLPVILDADALNLLAKNKNLYYENNIDDKELVFTPHMGEMSRLTGKAIEELKAQSTSAAESLAKQLHGICVLKSAVSIVSDGEKTYINSSGNEGMATAGSGDVLTGIIAGAALSKTLDERTLFEKVCLGTYLHGLAGDAACVRYGNVSMKAMDIAEAVSEVLK